MNIFLWVLGAVLLILGGTELVRLAVFWATKPQPGERMAQVVAPAGPEDCEALVRAAAERARWMGCPCQVVCLAPGGGETERICRFLSLQYPHLRVCKTDDLVYHILEE